MYKFPNNFKSFTLFLITLPIQDTYFYFGFENFIDLGV